MPPPLIALPRQGPFEAEENQKNRKGGVEGKRPSRKSPDAKNEESGDGAQRGGHATDRPDNLVGGETENGKSSEHEISRSDHARFDH